MSGLDALRAADFDWARQLSGVWSDAAWDVSDLHQSIRAEFVAKVEAMKRPPMGGSPLGWVIVGGGGTGKTHLLGAFRREAARRRAAFVLVDMTDVRDFWGTVLQGYIASLQQPFEGDLYQYQIILWDVIGAFAKKQPVAQILEILSRRKSTDLKGDIDKVLAALGKAHPGEARRHHNVVRALICLNSDDYTTSSLGSIWLQGQAIEDADRAMFGFSVAREEPRKIIEALSWFMGLGGPTILAFDQLDPIVTQLHYRRQGKAAPEEQAMAESIIVEIGGGLGALRDTTRNTLTVVSCVESTWEILGQSVLRTFLDRFEPTRRLSALGIEAIARSIVQERLAPAFREAGFNPPYPTWPFRPEAFEALRADTPREILRRCELHRQKCLREGQVKELASFVDDGPIEPPPDGREGRYRELDAKFQGLRDAADPDRLLEEKHEDERLAPLLQAALRCLIRERPLPRGIDARVDHEFTGGKTTQPLHARLRLIFQEENEREEHFCLRALQLTNAISFQNRLKAAITQSGIDHALKFRRLGVVRTTSIPGGVATRRITEEFEKAGGVFLKPTPAELRTIQAVESLEREPEFDAWLQSRRPISSLELIRRAVPSDLFHGGRTEAAEVVPDEPTPNLKPTPKPTEVKPPEAVAVPPPDETKVAISGLIPLGRRLVPNQAGEVVELPVRLLEKHTVVLAGAGSGKTVLLRRLVEEAVLLGVPAIVIDGANDLATLDEAWPEPPDGWGPGDAEKSRRYHLAREMVVWTPGKESGNPLALEPLPDLAPLVRDEDELEAALTTVLESLTPVVAAGTGDAVKKKRGILSKALRYIAGHGGGRLNELIDMLDDLPPEAGLGIANEGKLAKAMSDALRSQRETNPLLRSRGAALDPAVLFGADRPSARTRVSVISLIGLPGAESQRLFLNQLAMTLFTWIKQHPDPGARPLRGFLVIDEARDFVPSRNASTCRESLVRLAAQARKYHLGLVFATQNPKDIDHRIMSNCSTHVYGKMNSPAAIEVVQDLLRQKGGSGHDVPRLPRGQFYVHNADAGLPAPVKVATSLCLSRHPANPLDEAAIVKKAAASRQRTPAIATG